MCSHCVSTPTWRCCSFNYLPAIKIVLRRQADEDDVNKEIHTEHVISGTGRTLRLCFHWHQHFFAQSRLSFCRKLHMHYNRAKAIKH